MKIYFKNDTGRFNAVDRWVCSKVYAPGVQSPINAVPARTYKAIKSSPPGWIWGTRRARRSLWVYAINEKIIRKHVVVNYEIIHYMRRKGKLRKEPICVKWKEELSNGKKDEERVWKKEDGRSGATNERRVNLKNFREVREGKRERERQRDRRGECLGRISGRVSWREMAEKP